MAVSPAGRKGVGTALRLDSGGPPAGGKRRWIRLGHAHPPESPEMTR
jgi:hypothetical protein